MTDLQNNIANVLNTLQEAKEYADRAVDSANEAEIQASEAHTQAIEARDLIERAVSWLEENEDE